MVCISLSALIISNSETEDPHLVPGSLREGSTVEADYVVGLCLCDQKIKNKNKQTKNPNQLRCLLDFLVPKCSVHIWLIQKRKSLIQERRHTLEEGGQTSLHAASLASLL